MDEIYKDLDTEDDFVDLFHQLSDGGCEDVTYLIHTFYRLSTQGNISRTDFEKIMFQARSIQSLDDPCWEILFACLPADYENYDNILGVQANLWTEFISDRVHMYYNLLPRVDALSEVQWCGAENKNYERFKRALIHQFKVYDILDYPYSRAIFGEYGIPDKFKKEMQ